MEKNEMIGKIVGSVIAVILIIVFIVWFKNYLSLPSKRFYQVMDDFTSDISSASNVLNINIEKIFKGKKNINIDTKISTLNIDGTTLDKYKDLFSYNMISNIKLDTEKNYLVDYIEISNNENNKYNINYVEEGPVKLIKGTNERYKHIKNNDVNIKALDRSIFSSIALSIKNKLITDIKKEDIKKEKIKLSINSNTYDTNVSVYKIDGINFKKMAIKSLNSLNEEKNIVNYLIHTNEVKKSEEVINKLVESLNISDSKTYYIKTYVEDKTDKSLKLTIVDSDNNELFNYTYDTNYRLINLIGTKYELIGVKDDFTLVITDNKNITTITYKGSLNEASGEYRVKDISTNADEYYIEYSYTIAKNPASDSISFNLKYHPTSINNDTIININSSILVSDIIKIDEEYTYNYLNDNRKDSSFDAILNEYLDKVYNYFAIQNNSN